MTTINHQWRLAARPVGVLKATDFMWTEEAVPPLAEGQIRVRNLYLSLDPASRIWVTEMPSYLPPVGLGEVMRGLTVGVVEESTHPKFNVGDHVQGAMGWQEIYVGDGRGIQVLPHNPGIPLTAYLGLFGIPGMTAYFGLLDIGQPKEGETLVVTAAAGSVGSLAGQIGKIKGCRVVGIAGSDEKCRWIVDALGFDAAINYKTENVPERLQTLCPNGIDIDFENVGGKLLGDILGLINLRARIVLCGLIADYNNPETALGPHNFARLVIQRARVEGYVVLDYYPRAQEANTALAQWLLEGKLKYKIDEVAGLENAPTALNKLFAGTNTGKLVIKLA
jgi:hypothetical protein